MRSFRDLVAWPDQRPARSWTVTDSGQSGQPRIGRIRAMVRRDRPEGAPGQPVYVVVGDADGYYDTVEDAAAGIAAAFDGRPTRC